jgi:hypothetical protein
MILKGYKNNGSKGNISYSNPYYFVTGKNDYGLFSDI